MNYEWCDFPLSQSLLDIMNRLRIIYLFSVISCYAIDALSLESIAGKALETGPVCSESVFNRTRSLHEAEIEERANKTRAVFRCPDNKTLVGYSSSTCLEDGSLRRKIPICTPFECDFSSNLCGWTSDSNWKQQDGVIQSNDVPESESTKCTNFTLESPSFPLGKKNQDVLCFRFYYRIDTSAVSGSIDVSVEEHIETNTQWQTLFAARQCESSPGSSDWQNVTLPVGQRENKVDTYKIVIRGHGEVVFKSFLVDLCGNNTMHEFGENSANSSTCPSACEAETGITDNLNSTTDETTLSNSNSTSTITPDPQLPMTTTENSQVPTRPKTKNTKSLSKSFELKEIPVSVWIGIATGLIFLVIGGIAICLYVNGRKQRRMKKMADTLRRQMERSNSTPGSTLSMSSRSSTMEKERQQQKQMQRKRQKKKGTGPPNTLNLEYDARIWEKL